VHLVLADPDPMEPIRGDSDAVVASFSLSDRFPLVAFGGQGIGRGTKRNFFEKLIPHLHKLAIKLLVKQLLWSTVVQSFCDVQYLLGTRRISCMLRRMFNS
jgi:hypothetical protein